jgi:stearoyl-CoA desaturase (delta-9 desaturase)
MNPAALGVSEPGPDHRIDWVKSIPFFGVHVAAVVGLVLLGFSWSGFALCMALYVVRMFGVTGGYHRYFSHRSYRTSRVFQFLLAVLATTSVQKGVLWWAAHHRAHHKHSDEPGDVHSVKLDGFYWSHVGWILSKRWADTDESKVSDLMKYPELRWLDRYYLVPPIALAVVLFLIGGSWALVWGFFVSTVIVWHGTFTINSLTHMFGRRRYATTDNSKNNVLLGILVMGEGWHNNHHHYQRSVRQGFYWWEFDATFYVLKVMSWVGLVWDLHAPPAHVRDAHGPAQTDATDGADAAPEQLAPLPIERSGSPL